MINFKNPDEKPTSMIMVGSVVVMICAGLFMMYMPAPARQKTDEQAKKERTKLLIAVKSDKQKVKDADAAQAKLTWPGAQEEVMPLALQKVTAMAMAHHLKIVGFHPQKAIETPFITMLPCVVNLDGPFPNVVGFERDIESFDSKIAIYLAQFASADQSSNKVTASVGIMAYQAIKKPVTTDSTKAATPSTGTQTIPGTKTTPGAHPAPTVKPVVGVKPNA